MKEEMTRSPNPAVAVPVGSGGLKGFQKRSEQKPPWPHPQWLKPLTRVLSLSQGLSRSHEPSSQNLTLAELQPTRQSCQRQVGHRLRGSWEQASSLV